MGPFAFRCIRGLVLALAVVLVPAASAGAASLWTPVATNTTQTITAISAPSATELVFVTSGGAISYRTGSGTFAAAGLSTPNPTGFTAVAMSPDGTKGVAVGALGSIYHSADSGLTWTKNAAPTELSDSCPTPGSSTGPLSDLLYAVKWSDTGTVWITGAHDDVLRSTNSGGTFTEVNKHVGSCVADPGGSGQAFTDMVWLTPSIGYFLSNNFGEYFATTDGFAHATNVGTGANGFTWDDKLAVDPSSPNRAWQIAGGGGGSYFALTTDGGSNWSQPNYDTNNVSLQDIAFSGGTVITVGTSGDIYTSPDGVNFYRQIAGAPYQSNDWHAVAMTSASTAYVGGANGVLLATSAANTIPDTTAPTGSITGPTALNPGQFGTYTAHVTDNAGGSGVDTSSFTWSAPDNPPHTGATATFAFPSAGPKVISLSFRDLAGNTNSVTLTVNVGSGSSGGGPSGSSPSTHSTGGSKITIFKTVTVTGTSGRYIPVKLATKKPRRFVITLQTLAKHAKKLARMTVKLKKGKKTVHLQIGPKVKPGTYRLQVQVFTTGKHSHKIGKRVKQVFLLK
jgi:photosystem II stability/assembly factor-like uncharacterized protein